MHLKKILFPVVVFFIGFYGVFHAFAQQKKWTLEECVQYALENSILIKQAELDTNLAAVNKKSALGNFLPAINAASSHSWNAGLNQNITTGLLEYQTVQFTALNASVGIDIYRGLQNQNNLRKANLSIIANQYQLQKMKDDVSLNVIHAFLQILFNKENLKAQEQQLINNTKQLERITELVEAGVVAKVDQLEMEATIAADNQRVIAAQNALLISKLSLAQMLQLENFQEFDTIDSIVNVSGEEILFKKPVEIYEKAKEQRPELKIAQTNIEIAQKDLSIARGAYQPTLQGFYSIDTRAAYIDRIIGYGPNIANPVSVLGFVEGTNQNVLSPNFMPITGPAAAVMDQFNDNKGQSFGLRLSIPIFNGFSAKNNVSRAKISLKRNEFALEQEKLDLEQTIYTAFADATGSLKTYEAAMTAEKLRKETLRYTAEKYETGMLNAFELNQSQTLYINSQSETLRTKYDYVFRIKILAFYFGIPVTQN